MNIDEVLYHEFSHLIDRKNDDFGINEQKEREAQNIQPSEMTQRNFSLYKHIWNCYIDGRLNRYGKNPKTLQQRIDELSEEISKCDLETENSNITDIISQVWKSDSITFDDIISLTQRCTDILRKK
jgi:hypothetical protein